MRQKTVIIGAGHVGAHVASALAMQEICEEIVLIDKDTKKAWAHAQDIQDTAAYVGRECVVREGTWRELSDADVCVVCVCGKIFKEDRLEELEEALDLMDELIPRLAGANFRGVLVSITNPCDLVALYLHERTGYPVIGTGTALDSARFRVRIGRGLGIMPASAEAFCVGEHGDSQVQVWSQVRVGGRFLNELAAEEPDRYGNLDRSRVEKETTEAGWAILQGKGSTEYGIGAAAAEVIRALLRDSRKVLPCSIPFRRNATSPLIYASMPAVIRADGYPVPVPLRLNKEEQAAFNRSCRLLEQYRAEHLESRLGAFRG